MNREQFQQHCKTLELTDYQDDDCAVIKNEKGNQIALFIWSVISPEHVTLRPYYDWARDITLTEEQFLSITKHKLQLIKWELVNTDYYIWDKQRALDLLKSEFPTFITKIVNKNDTPT